MRVKGPGYRIILAVIFLLVAYDSRLKTESAFAEGDKFSFPVMEKAFLEGQYQKAVNEAVGLIDEGSPNRAEIYYIKGVSELKLGRYEAARKSFQYIISRYASSKRIFDAYIGLGDSYYMEKDLNAAIEAYEEAVFKFPKDENAAIADFRLAICYAAMGDATRANEFSDKARKAAPLSFEAREPMRIAASRAPDVSPSAGPSSGKGEHSVQVGYFKSRMNAEKLAQEMRARGYDAYVETVASDEGVFFRTKIGHYASAEEAVKASEELKNRGYNTKVCARNLCR